MTLVPFLDCANNLQTTCKGGLAVVLHYLVLWDEWHIAAMGAGSEVGAPP
jgi:hypothetical protein